MEWALAAKARNKQQLNLIFQNLRDIKKTSQEVLAMRGNWNLVPLYCKTTKQKQSLSNEVVDSFHWSGRAQQGPCMAGV